MVPCARASRTPPILATVTAGGEVFDYAGYQRQCEQVPDQTGTLERARLDDA
jgi:hypothetical protein